MDDQQFKNYVDPNTLCQWHYKSNECGYKGSLPDCDKTFADCSFHGQIVRFSGQPAKVESVRKISKLDLLKLKAERRAMRATRFFTKRNLILGLLGIAGVLTVFLTGAMIQSYFDFKHDIKALQQFKEQTVEQLRETNDKANKAHDWLLQHEEGFTK